MPDTMLTRADHETTVELQPATAAVVELEENPTTGFRWAIEQPLPPIFTSESVTI